MTEKLKKFAEELSVTSKVSRSNCFERLNVLFKIAGSDVSIIELISQNKHLIDEPQFSSLIYVLNESNKREHTLAFDLAYYEGIKYGYKNGYDDKSVNRPANWDFYRYSTFPCPFCGEHDFDKTGLKHHLNRYCEEYENTK